MSGAQPEEIPKDPKEVYGRENRKARKEGSTEEGPTETSEDPPVIMSEEGAEVLARIYAILLEEEY